MRIPRTSRLVLAGVILLAFFLYPALSAGSLPPVRKIVRDLAFSPDSTLLAVAGDDGFIKIIDAKTGKLLHTFTESPPLKAPPPTGCSVAFSPDGKLLAGGWTFGKIDVWNPQTGTLVRGWTVTDKEYYPNIEHLCFTPNGEYLIGSCNDVAIRIWSVSTGTLFRKIETGDFMLSLAVSRDGKTLAGAGLEGFVKLWEINTGKELKSFKMTEQHLVFIHYLQDERYLLIGTQVGWVKRWDLQQEKVDATLITPQIISFANNINMYSLSSDGVYLAGARNDSNVLLWNAKTGAYLKTYTGPDKSAARAVAFAPNVKSLAWGNFDGGIEIMR